MSSFSRDMRDILKERMGHLEKNKGYIGHFTDLNRQRRPHPPRGEQPLGGCLEKWLELSVANALY
jgi:hypothetical protein